MNLYQMKADPYGVGYISKFLDDNFVSIELRGVGNLENVDEAEVMERLVTAYGSKDKVLKGQLETVKLFVHLMQDGDYILVADEDTAHLGDLGDYFYDDLSDTPANGLCHRRGVTWLTRIPRAELNIEVQELLAQPEMITQFQHPIASAQLNKWSSNLLESPPVSRTSVYVDDKTIAEALEVLKKALHSDDVERRERAAIAILQYVK
ncbi:hypothetical protein [Paenibacillus wynnii]|uniref:hypothetical protein n=1 Tax=Paenibacillus wynnii TaxID=268407 RepID=UPI00278CBFE4|nr:hypothetical protein [Paenibacillus wynnii]MDQ0193027.1 hypothetical protein [Paenibacillus wynnii]